MQDNATLMKENATLMQENEKLIEAVKLKIGENILNRLVQELSQSENLKRLAFELSKVTEQANTLGPLQTELRLLQVTSATNKSTIIELQSQIEGLTSEIKEKSIKLAKLAGIKSLHLFAISVLKNKNSVLEKLLENNTNLQWKAYEKYELQFSSRIKQLEEKNREAQSKLREAQNSEIKSKQLSLEEITKIKAEAARLEAELSALKEKALKVEESVRSEADKAKKCLKKN